jgi:putative transcription antitermination factor YqgF
VYPLKTIKGKKPDSVMSELIRISLENKAELFVLGLPLAGDGKETAQSLKTRHFAKLLRIKSRKKVIFCNEENSTQEAYENLTISGVTGKKRTYSDDVAAAIILKRFFRENH